VGLTALTLAGAGARPEVRAVAAPSLPVGGSSAGAATALALDKQVVPLFSAEEAKDFSGQWPAIQFIFLTSPGRWWSRQMVLPRP
jgi:hypothetical protein